MAPCERRHASAASLSALLDEMVRIGLNDAIFVIKRGPRYAAVEVFEGERPAAHIPEQADGRWADFTASVRSRRALERSDGQVEVGRADFWQQGRIKGD
jgi:hypothetical protein